MQIGYGKRGVRIGEYSSGEGTETSSGLLQGSTSGDTNPVLGYMEPACDNPKWILWFMADGSAILHQERNERGGVLDEPLKIKAR